MVEANDKWKSHVAFPDKLKSTMFYVHQVQGGKNEV